MIAVKNLEGKDLKLSFNGNDYYFPKESTLLVDDDLAGYMAEVWPLAFEYGTEVPKGKVIAKPRVTKTKNVLPQPPTTDMKATAKSNELRPEEGTEGPDFYGAGIEKDSIMNGKDEE